MQIICRTALMELLSELLQLDLVLIPHIVRLLDAFLPHPADLSTQDLTQLIDSDTIQGHVSISCLAKDCCRF